MTVATTPSLLDSAHICRSFANDIVQMRLYV